MTPESLSLASLFWQADIVVKAVMIGLVAASVWSWAIIFAKSAQYKKAFRRSRRFEKAFWSASSLEELYEQVQSEKKPDPMSNVFAAAMAEWQHSSNNSDGLQIGLSHRIERVMRVTISKETANLERSVPFLATVGSTAPFVGLFGTVWGIMNSFTAIAGSKNTSLDVVAPGIAEALFATAIGLVAAIPAVVAYNRLINDLDRYIAQLETFADQMAAVVSRQLMNQPFAA